MSEILFDISQIIFADIILSGDNALIIGMAAAGLSDSYRKKAIFLGLALAALLRIIFAVLASFLLQINGILFFGGLLLGFVCWRFLNELISHTNAKQDSFDQDYYQEKADDESERKKLFRALVTITIADVSMSIDNVLAVAAIARENTYLLIFGLALAILFMAFFATIIMNLMTKFKWLSWAGLIFLVYLTCEMLYEGYPDFLLLIKTI